MVNYFYIKKGMILLNGLLNIKIEIYMQCCENRINWMCINKSKHNSILWYKSTLLKRLPVTNQIANLKLIEYLPHFVTDYYQLVEMMIKE